MKFYLTNEEKEKIKKLGILKVSQVAHFLQVSKSTALRLFKKNYLKYSTFKLYKKKVYIVTADEFIKFMENLRMI